MKEVEKIKELEELSNYLKVLKVQGYTMSKNKAEREIEWIEARLKELRKNDDVSITSITITKSF